MIPIYSIFQEKKRKGNLQRSPRFSFSLRSKKEKKPEVSPTNALLLDLLGPTAPAPALTMGGLTPLPATGNPFLSRYVMTGSMI